MWKNHERIFQIKSKNVYLIEDGSEVKKTKARKKCVIKRKLKFKLNLKIKQTRENMKLPKIRKEFITNE